MDESGRRFYRVTVDMWATATVSRGAQITFGNFEQDFPGSIGI